MGRLEAMVDRLAKRYGKGRAGWLASLLLIGVASVGFRLLAGVELESSALLYTGGPYLLALAITVVLPAKSNQRWWHWYREAVLKSLIVLLASSIVLFEGFICVALVIPIFLLIVSIVLACHWIIVATEARRNKKLVSILPLLILVSSFEGTTEMTSMERNTSATATRIANLTPDQVKRNLARPIDLNKKRNWLLSIFPMPYRIEAESLNPGDIHYMYTRYHRWFVTNTHEGEQRLQILDVTPTEVHTRIIHDTTFFSTYLTQIGSEISLNEIAPGQTEITLRLDYRRNLDPAWYFHPLQKYAMRQMAGFFIDEVMIR